MREALTRIAATEDWDEVIQYLQQLGDVTQLGPQELQTYNKVIQELGFPPISQADLTNAKFDQLAQEIQNYTNKIDYTDPKQIETLNSVRQSLGLPPSEVPAEEMPAAAEAVEAPSGAPAGGGANVIDMSQGQGEAAPSYGGFPETVNQIMGLANQITENNRSFVNSLSQNFNHLAPILGQGNFNDLVMTLNQSAGELDAARNQFVAHLNDAINRSVKASSGDEDGMVLVAQVQKKLREIIDPRKWDMFGGDKSRKGTVQNIMNHVENQKRNNGRITEQISRIIADLSRQGNFPKLNQAGSIFVDKLRSFDAVLDGVSRSLNQQLLGVGGGTAAPGQEDIYGLRSRFPAGDMSGSSPYESLLGDGRGGGGGVSQGDAQGIARSLGLESQGEMAELYRFLDRIEKIKAKK